LRASPTLVLLVLATLACGGPQSHAGTRADGSEDDPGLGPAITIPGSGVTFEPPPGASLLPLGPGVEVAELDMTIVLAIAEGDAEARRTLRDGLFLDGTDARQRDIVLAGDIDATLGRDALPGPTGAIARLWLVAERGDRILALLCTYHDGGDERTERLAAASLSSVRWDDEHPLSPSEAIGLTLGPVQGMSPDRRSLGTVALTEGGVGFPPPAGVPMAFLLPLTDEPPDEPSLDSCAAALARAGVLTDAVDEPRMLELDEGWGCEQSGEHRMREGGVLYAHGAVIFLPVGPVLLTAMVAPERRDEWEPRFTDLTRTVHHSRGED
jgi:hypothetical protein